MRKTLKLCSSHSSDQPLYFWLKAAAVLTAHALIQRRTSTQKEPQTHQARKTLDSNKLLYVLYSLQRPVFGMLQNLAVRLLVV